MNFQTLNKQRKFILIACVLGIISVFLPWVSISMFGLSESINGFRGWGIVVFFAFIIAAAISLLGNQTQTLEKNYWLASLACGAAALLSIVIALFSSSGMGPGIGIIDAGIGFGIWIAIAASAGVLLFSWIYKNPADNLKESFEGLKKSISIPTTPTTNAQGQPKTASSEDKIQQLERLTRLRDTGSISEEEFQQLKSKLI